jgi:hypothetical protein
VAWYSYWPKLLNGDSPDSNPQPRIIKRYEGLQPRILKRYEGLNFGPSLYLKPKWLGTLTGLHFSTEIH